VAQFRTAENAEKLRNRFPFSALFPIYTILYLVLNLQVTDSIHPGIYPAHRDGVGQIHAGRVTPSDCFRLGSIIAPANGLASHCSAARHRQSSKRDEPWGHPALIAATSLRPAHRLTAP
jgi:hypothetical protein